jgi:hypothetical protein
MPIPPVRGPLSRGLLVLPFSTLESGAPALAYPSKWHGVVTLTVEELGGDRGRNRELAPARRHWHCPGKRNDLP